MKVLLTDTAKLDLIDIDIVDYYDSHNPDIADRFENELQQRLETLGEFPHVGHAGFADLLELSFHDFPLCPELSGLAGRSTNYRDFAHSA